MKGGNRGGPNKSNKIIKSKFKKNRGKPFVDRKTAKKILKEKRARLVVRNLSFKATEESIREYFQQYGEVSNVELLKKSDGKLVGCAFVQFTLVQSAKKAQHYINNQPFLGRNLQVDFAKPKDLYSKEKEKKSSIVSPKIEEVKQEDVDKTIISIKDEEDLDNEVKYEPKQNNNNSENPKNSNSETEDLVKDEKKSFISHDVSEGRTVFIKNVPYDATNEDLRNCFLQFGALFYALICIDKITEHSKGTAFVKFVNKEDAQKALDAGTELTLLGNILDCHLAIDRNDLQNTLQSKKDNKCKPKDSRNLYLVKEGVILAGAKAAEGVSQTDMAKRLQIEQYKTQILRNLNTFVSRERLVVHNLPAHWDDKKFQILLQKHGGKGAIIKEARIMRNMRKLDAKGVGESKQYGFVTFTTHEHALAALRSLNNNPNIFTSQKRPIITFSIENKSALNAKLKRQQKSKLKNPKSKQYNPTLLKKENSGTVIKVDNEVQSFSGVTAKEGSIQKLRSKYKLNVQAKLHYENIKKEKRKQKMAKKTLSEKKKDFIKQPKQKINNKSKDDNFSKLVNDYKKMLTTDVAKKSKWYE